MSSTARPSKIVPRPGDTPGTGRRDDYRQNSDWLAAVGMIEQCVLCGSADAVQVAHRNEGKGLALKTPDALTASLCIHCHDGIDNGRSHSLEYRRNAMNRAIVLTLERLALAGVVVIDKKRPRELV